MQRSVPQHVEETVQRECVGRQEGAGDVAGEEEVEGDEVWAWPAWAAARVRPAARVMTRVGEGMAIKMWGGWSWWRGE